MVLNTRNINIIILDNACDTSLPLLLGRIIFYVLMMKIQQRTSLKTMFVVFIVGATGIVAVVL
jgi:hypothetical protein